MLQQVLRIVTTGLEMVNVLQQHRGNPPLVVASRDEFLFRKFVCCLHMRIHSTMEAISFYVLRESKRRLIFAFYARS
jgi:hypothetical protein